AVNGSGPAGRGQNQGQVFVQLKDWSRRSDKSQSVPALIARGGQHYASHPAPSIITITPPPIRGLGSSSGFDFELEDRGGVGHDGLMKARSQLMEMAADDPNLAQVRA